MFRAPVVAGMFYEADPASLKKTVQKFMPEPARKYKAIGVVAPHAGFIYSGSVAGAVYSSIEVPDLVIILGPNHTGIGEMVSVMTKGEWRTPLGDVKINEPLAEMIIRNCKYAEKDSVAHSREHSIEVQLPFLQTIKRRFSFVPVCLAEPDLAILKDLAASIAEAAKGKDVLIVASTDLTHYEPSESASKKDAAVLAAIEKLDPEQMINEVEKKDITMCGWMPVYTMLHAVKLMGAKEAKIIKYADSGDVSGDKKSVVGYGGAVII